jgi:hypothetical protein
MKVTDSELETEIGFEFSIISPKKSFILCAATETGKREWMAALTQAIGDLEERQKTFGASGEAKDVRPSKCIMPRPKPMPEVDIGLIAPILVPVSRVTMCHLCLVPFSLFQQRHHCRACGCACCSSCLRFCAVLPFRQHEPPARICCKCSPVLEAKNIKVTSS